MYYDNGGEPISIERWRELQQKYPYVRVGLSWAGRKLVSTGWIGTGPGNPPLIFETIVSEGGVQLESYRCASLGEAISQHLAALARHGA